MRWSRASLGAADLGSGFHNYTPMADLGWARISVMKESANVNSVMKTVQQQYLEQQLQLVRLSIVQLYNSVKDENAYLGNLSTISNSRLCTQLSNFRLSVGLGTISCRSRLQGGWRV